MGKGSNPLYHGVGYLSGDPDPLETPGLQLLGQRSSLVSGLAHGSTEVARWLCSCPQEHQPSQGWGSIQACRALRILAMSWGCWGQFREPGGGARLRNRAGTSGNSTHSPISWDPQMSQGAWENCARTETVGKTLAVPAIGARGGRKLNSCSRLLRQFCPGAGDLDLSLASRGLA